MVKDCQTNPECFAGSTSNMADVWREDLKLREDVERQGYEREEALDFLKRDFPMNAWSIRSLDRRLRYYDNPKVSVEDVKDAVKKELAMYKKVRHEYNLHVTRDAVYNVMYDLDPEGLIPCTFISGICSKVLQGGPCSPARTSQTREVPTCVAKCLS